MLSKLKNIFRLARSEEKYDFVYKSDDHFSMLKYKMKQYFNRHAEERGKYKAELDFIDWVELNIPTNDRKLYSIIPYDFTTTYDFDKVEVLIDEAEGLFYVYLDDKKLYYHAGYKSKEEVQKSFTYISAEQNPASPHRYLENLFSINNDDVVLDLGAAEGNFSLSVVDRVKHLIVVESDPVWFKALHKTFEPWRQKVTFINKFAGDKDDDNTITLESIRQQHAITAIKMDIEGAELSVLKASEKFLLEQQPKLAITTYHRHTDAHEIKHILERMNYQTVFSDGYLLFVYDNLQPPYFRKGLIRATTIS